MDVRPSIRRELPATPLFEILNWVLEQLNLDHFNEERDKTGDVVSLIFGKRVPVGAESLDDALEVAKKRLFAINLAGVMAETRERGIEPELSSLSKQVSREITAGGQRNTELYYAFKLVKVLARLNKKTFKLEAPPIAGVAPASVLSYLQESTRCWLYGFHGASVALSRACLEEVLKKAPPGMESARYDDLEYLINEAGRQGKLDGCMIDMAHKIRRTGNDFLHGREIDEKDSRESLDGVRSIAEQLFSI